MTGRVIVITSGKGGVGKTTTSANIGTALAKAGYKVVVFEFEVENGNSSNFNFGSYGFEGYADNVKVEPYYYMDSDIELNLAPGRTGTGTVAFEVPEDAQSIQADYDFGGNNIAVFVYGE